jgi:hypothetical protein
MHAGSASGSVPATRPGHRWLRATLSWFVALAGIAMALQLVVLMVDIGPSSVGVGLMIAVFALVGIGGCVAFWRLVGRSGGRPRLALALLIVAIAWAALSALTIAWLIAAFNPGT